MDRARARPVICIQTVGDAGPAAEILRGDSNVESVAQTNGELLVTLRDANVHHHVLIERLTAANIRLHAVAPQQLKLEDVFLRLTRGAVQ
jgi:hypothetical protein